MKNDSAAEDLVPVLLPRWYVVRKAEQVRGFPEVLRIACAEALRPASHDCTYCRLGRVRPRFLRYIASAAYLSVHCACCGRLKLPGDHRKMDVCGCCDRRISRTAPLTRGWV